MPEALTVGDLCLTAKRSLAGVACLLKIDEAAVLALQDVDVSALEDSQKRILFDAFKGFAPTVESRLYDEVGAWDAFVHVAAFIRLRDAAGEKMKAQQEHDAWQRRVKKAKAKVFQDQLAEGDFRQLRPQEVRHSADPISEEERRFWREQKTWKRRVETYKPPSEE